MISRRDAPKVRGCKINKSRRVILARERLFRRYHIDRSGYLYLDTVGRIIFTPIGSLLKMLHVTMTNSKKNLYAPSFSFPSLCSILFFCFHTVFAGWGLIILKKSTSWCHRAVNQSENRSSRFHFYSLSAVTSLSSYFSPFTRRPQTTFHF